MADDGLLFPAIAKVHPRYRTPYVAIVLAALLGIALVMSRSFERLTDTFVLAIWPFYAVAVAAIYRLRRSAPQMARPYRAIGYPLVPALFIVAVAAFVLNSLMHDTTNSVITFALIGAGIPVFYAFFA
jgi:amino acid transporter